METSINAHVALMIASAAGIEGTGSFTNEDNQKSELISCRRVSSANDRTYSPSSDRFETSSAYYYLSANSSHRHVCFLLDIYIQIYIIIIFLLLLLIFFFHFSFLFISFFFLFFFLFFFSFFFLFPFL